MIVDLHGTQIGGIQAALQQTLQHQRVTGDDAELGSWSKLVGNQLADLIALGTQVLQARVGEVGDQQQSERKRRQQADHQCAGVDVAAVPGEKMPRGAFHGEASRRCSACSSWCGSVMGMPSDRATRVLPITLKWAG
ncbi:hypothetical protein D3C77_609520 [compost metagenome]